MSKKTEEKSAKRGNGFWVRTIIFILIVVAISCTFFFQEKLENFINPTLNKEALSTTIEEDGLIVHFIDVGQADAILVEFPNNEIMLIDTGDVGEKSQEKLGKYLENICFETKGNEKVIDYLVLTHPDSDHIGGAINIFENYLVENCYLPQIYTKDDDISEIPNAVQHTSTVYANTISALTSEITNSGCVRQYCVEGLSIKTDNYNASQAENSSDMWIIEFLTPITGEIYLKDGSLNLANTNEYSPLMILSYMSKKVMFTGDAGKIIEEDFLEEYASAISNYDVDVLKVGHHGSKNSTSTEFLNAVKPEYAIISVGVDNSYGHPSDEALERLTNYGLSTNNIYRTDLNGNILVGVSKSGVLSLEANHVQYTTTEVKLWYIVLGAIVVCAIVIYAPYITKAQKMHKKSEKLFKKHPK